jgi:DNA-binding MarR family transcriptional regulator
MAGTALAPLGFSPRHYALMTALETADGPSQRAIADILSIDRATVVALADDLEALGLVRRARSARDRRVNALLLTTEGRRALAEAHRLMDSCEQAYLRVLPPADRRQLADLLERLLSAR